MKKAAKKRSDMSGKTARVTSQKPGKVIPDELRPHYDFDYSKSRPNRFSSDFTEGTVAVVLDADVAAVFPSSKAVNSFLRSVISALPQETAPKKRRVS